MLTADWTSPRIGSSLPPLRFHESAATDDIVADILPTGSSSSNPTWSVACLKPPPPISPLLVPAPSGRAGVMAAAVATVAAAAVMASAATASAAGIMSGSAGPIDMPGRRRLAMRGAKSRAMNTIKRWTTQESDDEARSPIEDGKSDEAHTPIEDGKSDEAHTPIEDGKSAKVDDVGEVREGHDRTDGGHDGYDDEPTDGGHDGENDEPTEDGGDGDHRTAAGGDDDGCGDDRTVDGDAGCDAVKIAGAKSMPARRVRKRRASQSPVRPLRGLCLVSLWSVLGMAEDDDFKMQSDHDDDSIGSGKRRPKRKRVELKQSEVAEKTTEESDLDGACDPEEDPSQWTAEFIRAKLITAVRELQRRIKSGEATDPRTELECLQTTLVRPRPLPPPPHLSAASHRRP